MQTIVIILVLALLVLLAALGLVGLKHTSRKPSEQPTYSLEDKEQELIKACNQLHNQDYDLYLLKKGQLKDINAMIREKKSYQHECDMTALKMTKSVELYNLLYKLIKDNPHLFGKFRDTPTDNCVTILGNMANLSPKERQEYQQVFYQVVEDIKSLPPMGLPAAQKRFQPTTLAQA